MCGVSYAGRGPGQRRAGPSSQGWSLRTREVGCEAEGVVEFLGVLAVAVVAHTPRGSAASPGAPGPAQAAAGLPGLAHRVLHRAVAQPTRVAPVQAVAPGRVQLLSRRQDAVLFSARALRLREGQLVAASTRVVREDYA